VVRGEKGMEEGKLKGKSFVLADRGKGKCWGSKEGRVKRLPWVDEKRAERRGRKGFGALVKKLMWCWLTSGGKQGGRTGACPGKLGTKGGCCVLCMKGEGEKNK